MPATPKKAKPDWLKIRPPSGARYTQIKSLVKGLKLNTVCEEAHCPNVAECWGGGTATIMLMGDTCTRGCRFCNVKTGNPRGLLDANEPGNVAEAISTLGLSYVVLTSVDRDDLPDGGAGHFAQTVSAIKRLSASTLVEVLVPDFSGSEDSIRTLLNAAPDVFAQNLETVKRLTQRVRDPRCGYRQTLTVLEKAKKLRPSTYTKSSIMVGLGESRQELSRSMDDLLAAGCQILTFGQYLQPSARHLPVEQYVHPTVFRELREEALSKGFLYVASGPLVRSSYRAGELFLEGMIRGNKSETHQKSAQQLPTH